MKVYVLVSRIEYEGDYVMAVYSSEEKAQAAKDEAETRPMAGDQSYEILEEELQ